jgi:transcriptional regulator with XRE-family HTH domain
VLRTILRQARLARGLSQRELAGKLGKWNSHIALIEGGQRRVDGLELFVLAEHLSNDPAEFLAKIQAELIRVRQPRPVEDIDMEDPPLRQRVIGRS